jgi:predicted Rossmann-fold nucleotide-binding protein
MLVKAAEGFVLCEGGFGTLDELFESLVLIQTGKILHFPVVLVGIEQWRGLLSWIDEKLIDEKLIAPQDVLLLSMTDDPSETVRIVLDCYERNCAHVIEDAEAAAS